MAVTQLVGNSSEKLENKGAKEKSLVSSTDDVREPSSEEYTLKEFICGEEALRISSAEPYCLSRPIRRGHFNVSEHYPLQQVLFTPQVALCK